MFCGNAQKQALDQDSQTQTTNVNWSATNGGYINIHLTGTINWHWDNDRQKVVVTAVNLNLIRSNPQTINPNQATSGFWDTIVVQNPNMPAPSYETHSVEKVDPDTGQVLWNKINGSSPSSGVFKFFSQNDKTEQWYVYTGGATVPYDAVKNSDNTWTLLKWADRYNSRDDGLGWNGPGDISTIKTTAKWSYANLIGTPPIPPSRTVHYHNNSVRVFVVLFVFFSMLLGARLAGQDPQALVRFS